MDYDLLVLVSGGLTAILVELSKVLDGYFGKSTSRIRQQLLVGSLALVVAIIYAATPQEILVEAGKIIVTAVGIYELLIKNVYKQLGM